ncbi:MAG: AI-2E family transporter [Deferrisomatales bacterium]
MELSLDRFYQLNRRALIWLLLFAALWFLGDFFGLIFLVFFFSFVSAALSGLLRRYLRLPNAVAIVVVYGCFLAVLAGFLRYVAPQVVREGELLVRNLGQIETTLLEHKSRLVGRHPGLDALITGYLRGHIPEEDLEELEQSYPRPAPEAPAGALPGLQAPVGSPETLGHPPPTRRDQAILKLFLARQMDRLRAEAPHLAKLLWQGAATTMLALLFSFLISLDAVRLRRGVDSLRLSRLKDFYEQTAQPVVRFGYVVGRAVQAQALIACLNTLLTAAGFWFLGIPSLAPLALLVFLCSFVPVLGVFLSTTPAVLLALNAGGLSAAFWVVAMVIGVHAVETYLLNPVIYGRHMKLNPALVLMILYVGHHTFGVWGMVLGVPVAYYLLHDVLGVPVWGGDRTVEPPPAVDPPPAVEPGPGEAVPAPATTPTPEATP